MKHFIPTVLLAAFALLAGGCDSKQPTKENAVQLLKDAYAALSSGNYDKAKDYFVLPANASADDVKKNLGRLIEIKEISPEGIDILADKGKWGKIKDVSAKETERAKKLNLPEDECYGLYYEGAEVALHWDGKKFRLFRLDDVGKLVKK